MTGKWGSYHRKCFKCMKCKRPLDYATLSEGPDNEVYCKNCYSYEHGHKAKPNLHDADVSTLQVEYPIKISVLMTNKTRGMMEGLTCVRAAKEKCLRLRSRLPSLVATIVNASPVPSANIRWIQQTLPTVLTMTSTASTAMKKSMARRPRQSQCLLIQHL